MASAFVDTNLALLLVVSMTNRAHKVSTRERRYARKRIHDQGSLWIPNCFGVHPLKRCGPIQIPVACVTTSGGWGPGGRVSFTLRRQRFPL